MGRRKLPLYVFTLSNGSLANVANHKLRARKVRFLGKTYDRRETNYFDLPWEIEATGREDGLVVRFFEAYPKYDKRYWGGRRA